MASTVKLESEIGEIKDFTQDQEMCLTFSDLIKVRHFLNELDELEAKLRKQIQRAMGSANRATFAGGEVAWVRARNGCSFEIQVYDKPEKSDLQLVGHPS